MTGWDPNDVTPPERITDQRRRHVLRCLDGRDDGMALADLAADVTALERDENAREVPQDTVHGVYLSLYHCHVPKLADDDVVDFREDRNAVSLASESGEPEKIRQVSQSSGF